MHRRVHRVAHPVAQRLRQRAQVLDQQGVDRTITLTSWSPDATLPKNAFTFVTPKGVKISTKIPGSR